MAYNDDDGEKEEKEEGNEDGEQETERQDAFWP